MLGLFNCSSKKQISELFSESSSLKNKIFSSEQIKSLPAPVQKYFNYALSEGQTYLSNLHLKHTGRFKTGVEKDWIDIKGEQYFTAQPPGFIWIGKTKAFKATDSYVSNKGNLSVYLFGFLRIVKSERPTVNQAELLRWLGESVWMPTNLLPSEHISWSPIDENTAKLNFEWQNENLYYIVHFNEKGQITKLVTERYMNPDRLEKWVGCLNNYQEINGMMIPRNIKASWLLEKGKHTYADFHVEEFNHNTPKNSDLKVIPE